MVCAERSFSQHNQCVHEWFLDWGSFQTCPSWDGDATCLTALAWWKVTAEPVAPYERPALTKACPAFEHGLPWWLPWLPLVPMQDLFRFEVRSKIFGVRCSLFWCRNQTRNEAHNPHVELESPPKSCEKTTELGARNINSEMFYVGCYQKSRLQYAIVYPNVVIWCYLNGKHDHRPDCWVPYFAYGHLVKEWWWHWGSEWM